MSLIAATSLQSLPRMRDIMTPTVVTVAASTSAAEVARILVDHSISGAPVVDGSGRLVGGISLRDLVRRERGSARTVSSHPDFFGEVWFEDLSTDGCLTGCEQDEEGSTATAADLMSARVLTIPVNGSLSQAVRLMLSEHVHRLLVTDHGRTVGIVSTLDILRFVPALVDLARLTLPPD